jgi:hypothetical protein
MVVVQTADKGERLTGWPSLLVLGVAMLFLAAAWLIMS